MTRSASGSSSTVYAETNNPPVASGRQRAVCTARARGGGDEHCDEGQDTQLHTGSGRNVIAPPGRCAQPQSQSRLVTVKRKRGRGVSGSSIPGRSTGWNTGGDSGERVRSDR